MLLLKLFGIRKTNSTTFLLNVYLNTQRTVTDNKGGKYFPRQKETSSIFDEIHAGMSLHPDATINQHIVSAHLQQPAVGS